MPLTSGSRLGVYEVVGLLGAGGMGEVYRARDHRLRREVALKVLPELQAADADRLARFEREAQLLAALSHPNIATIHGIEEADGVRALVLELVDGPALDERLRQGALAISESLRLARQLVAALEAAHHSGIIHRDLKPANIKLRPDGTVKVLDFGLARAVEPVAAGPSPVEHSTMTSGGLTVDGTILGTTPYMSPEQARGLVVDRRTDIWAFGCVLFEMLTGRRAFAGKDVPETIARVLTKDPDWTALPAGTPLSVRRLLRRCLAKDHGGRLADIADAETVRAMGEGVMKRFGKVDILVLNASQRREVLFKDMSFDEWRNTMSITLDGSFHCIKACLPSMLANRQGNIVTLAGDAVLLGGNRKAHNTTAKNGLVGLTRAQANELAEDGIRVNCVSPGSIETMRPAHRSARSDPAHAIPLGRRGESNEIAAVVRFLCGPGGGFITGQTIHVNGGALMFA